MAAYNPQTWADLPALTSPFTAARMNYIETGIAGLGTMSTYTPTWTNLTVGNGTPVYKYSQIGNIVFLEIRLTFGTTTAITGNVSVSLPITAAGATSDFAAQGVMIVGGSQFPAYPSQTGTTAVGILYSNTTTAAGQFGALSATVPGTWASGDRLSIGLVYEV